MTTTFTCVLQTWPVNLSGSCQADGGRNEQTRLFRPLLLAVTVADDEVAVVVSATVSTAECSAIAAVNRCRSCAVSLRE